MLLKDLRVSAIRTPAANREFLGVILNDSLNLRHILWIPAVRLLDTLLWEGATAWRPSRSAAAQCCKDGGDVSGLPEPPCRRRNDV